MTRILIHSNVPTATSAYAQQAGMLALAARDLGHDVAISAMCGALGPQADWNGITVYPASTVPGTYGIDQVPYFYAKHNADLVILLVDAVVVADNAHLLAGLSVAHWMPVDTSTLPDACADYLSRSGAVPVAMSRFGERVLGDAGFDPLYMPHAVDTRVFTIPEPEQKQALHDALGASFVIGMNAANRDTGRKCFFEQFEAFRHFHGMHPDSLLYVHTLLRHPYGLDLERMLRCLGIRDAVVFPDQGVMAAMEITPALLARNFYHVLDLYSGCSAAEGFGVPLIEAQACGVRVVASHGSAMTELFGTGGFLVDTQPLWNETYGSCWARPSVAGIATAYETAYQTSHDPERSRAFARAYDLSVLAEGPWQQALKELEARLG